MNKEINGTELSPESDSNIYWRLEYNSQDFKSMTQRKLHTIKKNPEF